MSRVLVVLSVVLACASAAGAEPASSPTSASILLHLHPRPWQPPAAMARPVLGGVIESPDDAPLQAEIAAMRAARAAALAGIPVQFHPDGSRFAVLGGLIRAYAVARIGADGSLDQGCVDSEDGAFEWLAVPPAPAPTPAVVPAPAPVPGKGGK